MRTCVGCRRRAPQNELVRVARTPTGGVGVGRTLPGRGAWLCAASGHCLGLAVTRNALSRALRSSVSADEALALERDLSP